jgi:hypothetical protein
MADSPRPPVPTSLDRAAVERILARATELQSTDATDPEGRLTEAQLEALAKEVGLDPLNLRQAIAEERTRTTVPTERGLLASLYGGAFASAQRTVAGRPADVLRALDDWMQRQEGLIVQRHFADRIVWESRRDFVGAIRRVASGRGHALMRASTVGATVIALDGNRSLVRLDADLGGHRSLMANQAAAFTGAGAVATGTLVALSFMMIAAVAPVVVLTPLAYTVSRSAHRGALSRAQLVLEQVLDRLERGDAGRPPSLISMLATAVGVRKL